MYLAAGIAAPGCMYHLFRLAAVVQTRAVQRQIPVSDTIVAFDSGLRQLSAYTNLPRISPPSRRFCAPGARKKS